MIVVVKYANGKAAKIPARGWEALMGLGFREEMIDGTAFKGVNENPYDEFRFFNVGLMTTVAKVLSEGGFIPAGTVAVEDEERGKKNIEELDIPIYPVVYSEKTDTKTFRRWEKKWIDEGIRVNDSENHGLCVSKILLGKRPRKNEET